MAFHKFSRRYEFAITSIGTATTTRTSPPPYADDAASAASVAATVPAGADDAIPITVSCTTPIASGSSRAAGASAPAGRSEGAG